MGDLAYFNGGPLNGREVRVEAAVRELRTPQNGLMLRYMRVGPDFWLDEWSRPLTDGELALIRAEWGEAWDRHGAHTGTLLIPF